MKNSVRKCTAALCLMTLCAALTACGPGGKAKETEESGTGRTEEGSEIWIDGKPGNGEEDSKGQGTAKYRVVGRMASRVRTAGRGPG